METIIKINKLSKLFEGNETVSNVNMKINRGEIYGFLGPNGAGKTTIMKMILNLVKPSSGEIIVLNQPVLPTSYQYLKNIGSIIEYPVFYDRLTAKENLDFHCEYVGYHDKRAVDEALEIVGLKDVGNKKIHEFSLGMKQRLGIARAIVTKPEILILDEPINGLDPIGIKDIRELLLLLKEKYGITILISSHIVSEIESIADTIGIINQGKLLKEVKMEEIRKENIEYLEIEVDNLKKTTQILEDTLGIKKYEIVDQNTIRIFEQAISQYQINKELILNDVIVKRIERKQHNLEEYFLNLINGGGQHV
ncbi:MULTISPECIES: ABC transporter ATP-binding protein [unclassified Bacillus (in: firmicutes)]|uniref:ABC transporter ATP-binding protein n=1 Tax=unclassified Bacillus (in: firmicutes) TaxID=185979 RepID=UPI0008F0CDE8|nr:MULTISPECIES: ATP-binding cassette domain-containing protein [unclassified Bacillus (in: firmicutes)]SFI72367.1 ABC-2 type transport system ATP-binding protein [Bacillus sp. 71mf]SFS88696.1 ABC-2 type transport system ATP-binding protein [Bacillus sp. 103mf]